MQHTEHYVITIDHGGITETIPLGDDTREHQAIEVYEPMLGGLRGGESIRLDRVSTVTIARASKG